MALTLCEIAELANMTVTELLSFAERESRLKAVLEGVPLGVPGTGIPPKPHEMKIVLKQELSTFDYNESNETLFSQ
jgi:hypothetical protein